jgi:NAD(P)-dependent dehydrogenase (short-subunit alcohol dehydrogenase family)
MSFAGRTAVVTGAGGGMGFAIARELAAAGAAVWGIDVKPAPEEVPGLHHRRGSITDEAFVEGVMEEAFATTGRLDHLVNAAGVLWFGRDKSLVETETAVWDQVIAVNLTGCAVAARRAVPLMRRSGGGAMVHVSSIQCLRGDDRPQDAYQVSKAGVIALSKSLAIQFARDGIRSNALLPGPTESPMQSRWRDDPAGKAATAAAVPLGRVGTVRDMADACLFLLSEKSSYITGTELIVDGGLLAKP